jgi:hypothetical protein
MNISDFTCIQGQRITHHGQIIEENEIYEFKSLLNSDPLKSFSPEEVYDHAFRLIKQEFIKNLFCFMNAALESAYLCFGVSDDAIVQGCHFTAKQKDVVSRFFRSEHKELKNQELPENAFSVHFLPVENQENLQDLYVIVVAIYPSTIEADEFLYLDKQVFFRNGGACDNLSLPKSHAILRDRITKKLQETDSSLKEHPDNKKLNQQKIQYAKRIGDMKALQEAHEAKIQNVNNNSEHYIRFVIRYSKDLESIDKTQEALDILDHYYDPEKIAVPIAILLQKASLLKKLGYQKESDHCYEKVTSQDPQNYVAITELGMARCLEGDYFTSVCLFKEALKICPQYRRAKYEYKLAYSQWIMKLRENVDTKDKIY